MEGQGGKGILGFYHRRHARRVCELILLIFWVTGCAVDQGKVYVKNGKRYGETPLMTWRSRWWDYYQRGSSYAEGEYWQDAINDFQKAIQQRPADQWRAKTYGLHFLNYFPHRELGVAYYQLKRYPEAIDELELSLHSAASAKAKFYLNKARKAILKQSGKDSKAPRIVLDAPPDGLLTNRFSIRVTGHVEDDFYVAGLSVDGQARFIELSEPRIDFEQDIILEEGANSIEILCTDLVGHLARRRITVTVDRRGPIVGLDRAEVIRKETRRFARVQGYVADRSGIVRFVVAGNQLPLEPGNEWEFDTEIPIPSDLTALPFSVVDGAGNITKGYLRLSSAAGRMRNFRQIEQAALLRPRFGQQLQPLSFSAGRAIWAQATENIVRPKDRYPPAIKPVGLAAEQEIYINSLFIEGKVSDDSAVTAFYINGESFLRRPSRELFFNYLTPLIPGANRFVLEALDNSGRLTTKEITVTYIVPAVERFDSRLRVVLYPPENTSESTAIGEAVYGSLYNALVEQGRFVVVEREKLAMILRELKLSRTALVDPDTAAEVGKIAAAEGMLAGTVTAKGSGLMVWFRFVDVETREAMVAEDVYGEDLDLQSLKILMEGLAWKVRRRFPIVEGVILDIEDDLISIDLTHKDGVQRHMKLILFREGGSVQDPRSGEMKKKPAQLMGEARIRTVSDELSEAALLTPEIAGKVHPLDKVITK